MAETSEKRIHHIQFGMFSSHEMINAAELPIVNRELYQAPTRNPVPYGVLDKRLVCSVTGHLQTNMGM